MRTGIAIDVSTDVSDEFIRAHRIHVLPSTIHMGDASLVYDRDPERGLAFYREQLSRKGFDAETTPLSVPEIEDLFLKQLVLEYDYVFLITLAATRSLTFENAHKASFQILQSYQRARSAQGVPGPFALRVLDSRSLFTGPGVLAWEAARLVKESHSPLDIRARLDALVPYTHAYMIPQDLYYIRSRVAKRGPTLGLVDYLVGRTLDIKPVIDAHASKTLPVARVRGFERAVERLFRHGARCIERGLLVPVVGLSYGGDPQILRSLSGFDQLESAARAHGVELMLSMMAPAAAVNVGAGAVSLGFCGDPGEFR